MRRHILGARTRQDIRSAVIPTGRYIVQSGGRASVALALYLAGYAHLAQILAVLAVMVLIGSVEARIALALSDGISRLGRAKLGFKKTTSPPDDSGDPM